VTSWTVKDFELHPPASYEAMDESTWTGEYRGFGVTTDKAEERKFSVTVFVNRPRSGGPLQNLVYQDVVRILTRRFNAGRLPVLGEDIQIALPEDVSVPEPM